MSGDLGEAKSFLRSNTGQENTVIIADNNVQTAAEQVSEDQAMNILDETEVRDTGTDLVSALRRAQRIEGQIFVGSDLDQTSGAGNVQNIFGEMRAEKRSYKSMDLERRNSWGVIGLETGRDNTTVEVKNFESRENSITVAKGGDEREINISGKSVESVTFQSSEGKNTVELEDDSFSKDNNAYFQVPDGGSFDITFIADEENRFLIKAFELMDFTDIEYLQPPVERELDADMYIVGETDRMISETAGEIQEQVKSGKDMVIFSQQDFEELGFEELPFSDQGAYSNESVTLSRPERIDLSRIETRNIEVESGERLAGDSNAAVMSEYGEGEALLYNIPDSEFNQDFLYPVFWKGVAEKMLERRSIDDMNYRTGQEITGSSITGPDGTEYSGRTELENQGFYETPEGLVAVNMLNEDESLRDVTEIEPANGSVEASKASVQHLVVLFVLCLLMVEAGYLYRIGDLR
jgi:hypothetical protein